MKVVVRLMVLALTAMMACSVLAASSNDQKVVLKTDQDKLSYALGVETGRSFKAHDVKIDSTIFAQGINDGLQGTKPQMSDEDIQKQISNFQQETLAKMQQQLKDAADTNQKAEQQFLADNKAKPGVVTTASGLQYKIIDAGKGDQPIDTDLVTVDYEGKLLNGKVFDSSYKRGKPASFPVAAVIPGWQEALKLMHPGATWELYIPSKLAYGDQGAGGLIGPNEMLIFKVHLISVKTGPGKPGNSQS